MKDEFEISDQIEHEVFCIPYSFCDNDIRGKMKNEIKNSIWRVDYFEVLTSLEDDNEYLEDVLTDDLLFEIGEEVKAEIEGEK